MPRELERAVVALVIDLTRSTLGATPWWLKRPGHVECGDRWPLVTAVYAELSGGGELPAVAPTRERRTVDAVLVDRDGGHRILEVDEIQHFNAFRATTLQRYRSEVSVAFDIEAWLRQCQDKRRLEGGGFARPRPPLFPGQNGRHRQRAFRDALTDILPVSTGGCRRCGSATSKWTAGCTTPTPAFVCNGCCPTGWRGNRRAVVLRRRVTDCA